MRADSIIVRRYNIMVEDILCAVRMLHILGEFELLEMCRVVKLNCVFCRVIYGREFGVMAVYMAYYYTKTIGNLIPINVCEEFVIKTIAMLETFQLMF